MPWAPELFSGPALAQLEERRQRRLTTVPYFDGLMTGELDPLLGSFAGEPELHHPVRGRIRGARAFEAYFSEMQVWFSERIVSVEDVDHVVTERRGFEENVVHLHGGPGQVGLSVAVVADRRSDGRIEELRMYYSGWPLTGRHANRPPVLQPDPDLHESGVREPAGGEYVHRGTDGVRSFFERLFSNDEGIPLEHCAAVDDGRACGLEYNVVRGRRRGLCHLQCWRGEAA